MSNLRIGIVAVAVLLVMAWVARTCGYGEPLVIPDWADSLGAVRAQYTEDTEALRADLALMRQEADSAKRDAEAWRRRSLANRPTRPQTKPTDSLSLVYPDSVSGLVSGLQAQNDSLWAALDASDSAYQSLSTAFDAQKQATAAALAWKDIEAARADSTEAVATRAIGDLTDRLTKAQRGCRVPILSFISCPEATGGYGAVLSDGQVHHGPGIQVGFEIKLGGG